MEVAYVTIYDLLDRQTWPKSQPGLSQATYTIAEKLKLEGFQINYIGSLAKKFAPLTKLKWNIYARGFQKDYYRWAEPLVVKDYAFQIDQKIAATNSEIVVATENILPLAYLKSHKPLILWTDTPLAALINFYPYLSNLCKETTQNIYQMEAAKLNRCHKVFYTSEWAAQKAIEFYHLNSSKVGVIPWGANLHFNESRAEIERLIEAKQPKPCKLLFLGADWVRKGGETAFQVGQDLNAKKWETELTIVGCQPKLKGSIPAFVKSLGFINTSTQDGFNQIKKLLAETHFLILPTIADCSPHVLAEANALGVPCLTTKVGGILTMIKDGINGKCFDVNAPIEEYSDYILHLMNNYDEYKQLCLSAYDWYHARLNWDINVQQFSQVLKTI